MITVAPHAEENISSKTVFDTKGLAVIWGKFPEYYSAKNTIHVRPTSSHHRPFFPLLFFTSSSSLTRLCAVWWP